MPKTHDEISRIARERIFAQIEELSYPELKVLRALINRDRYPLKDQEEFIRFYFAARAAQHRYSEKSKMMRPKKIPASDTDRIDNQPQPHSLISRTNFKPFLARKVNIGIRLNRYKEKEQPGINKGIRALTSEEYYSNE